MVTAAVPGRVKDEVEKVADKDRVSVSEVVRRSLSAYLESKAEKRQ
jgi:Arc/MetJ-type ribon-helix-helix transcriptional regulator